MEGSCEIQEEEIASGGRCNIIRLQEGERITGVAGATCTSPAYRNLRFVMQLTFSAQKADGQKVVYGPFGTGNVGSNCRLFAVNGKITSIFGRLQHSNDNFVGLGAIGFYFQLVESRGGCLRRL